MGIKQGEVFKNLVKARRVTIKDLSNGLGISVPTIFVWYKQPKLLDKNISLICAYFNISKEVFYSNKNQSTNENLKSVSPGKKESKKDLPVIHHGKILRDLLKSKRIPRKTLAEGIGISEGTIYGWYKQTTLLDKNITLICGFLNIDKDVFTNPGKAINDSITDGNTDGHEGRKLEYIMQEKHIDVTAISRILNVSRPTVYKLFTNAVLPDDILLKAANYFNVPTSYFSGATKSIF